MANFAVAASPETIELANKVMGLYAKEGEKKEDTLLRILALAESESVKGTHPEMEGALTAVNGTIDTLIKQINGIVAGQDMQILEQKKKIDQALEEKQKALEEAKLQMDVAEKKSAAATDMMSKAARELEQAKTQAQAETRQAIRERDDARIIAEEKTASNSLLKKQVEKLETELAEYKELGAKYEELQEKYSLLNAKSELEKERAVMARERELNDLYQEKLRQVDKENVRLALEIERLKKENS
jgi:5-deoxy-D-glucuronate isomerase